MKKVLIVEDDPLATRFYRLWLEKHEITAKFCSNILDAINYIASRHVDLIISDHHLPDSNSTVLLRSLSIWNQNIPVVIISSNPRPLNNDTQHHNFVKQVLFKPIQLSDFDHIINTHLKA